MRLLRRKNGHRTTGNGAVGYHEAQELRQSWHADTPSYLRLFLNNGEWGQDETWTRLAEIMFKVLTAIYFVAEPFIAICCCITSKQGNWLRPKPLLNGR